MRAEWWSHLSRPLLSAWLRRVSIRTVLRNKHKYLIGAFGSTVIAPHSSACCCRFAWPPWLREHRVVHQRNANPQSPHSDHWSDRSPSPNPILLELLCFRPPWCKIRTFHRHDGSLLRQGLSRQFELHLHLWFDVMLVANAQTNSTIDSSAVKKQRASKFTSQAWTRNLQAALVWEIS